MAEPLRKAGELAARIGQVVEVRGRYEVWDMGPHRVLTDLPDGQTRALRQVVNLVLDDASVVRLWDRPAAEMAALGGATVVVRGRLLGATADGPGNAPAEAPSLMPIERITAA